VASENGLHAPSSVRIHYQLLRNTTSPDETATGVRSYVANVAAPEILKLGTEGNLRNYIAEYNARKRNRVHLAIRDTIETEAERFITRNSGFVVACSDADIDDGAKAITLVNPSIINGAQSQGEIRKWIDEAYPDGMPADDPPFYVRVEVIVDADPLEIVETAIARNNATAVKSISQAGARGQLRELQEAIARVRPDIRIQTSETDQDAFDTRKILQWARLLMPEWVSKSDAASEKLRPYKNPEQCLNDFSEWYETKASDPDAAAKYRFTIEIAASAIAEYQYWEGHEAWNGKYIWEETARGRAVRRDKTGKIVWASPGLVFPIMSAMRRFVVDEGGSWKISKPTVFKPADMISQSVGQFRSVGSDPMQMGRSIGAYEALLIYTTTIITIVQDMRAERGEVAASA
jgi:AIPR protein